MRSKEKIADDDNAFLIENLKASHIRRRDVSVMSSTLLVMDKSVAAEGLLIDGNLECAMAHHQKHVTISENARVVADVHGGTVVVFGQLTGNIVSDDKVTLVKGSRVDGDICCKYLDIEEGAQFKGQVVMDDSVAHPDLEYS